MKEYMNTDSIVKEEGVDFKELLFTYLGYWYWFVLSVVVCFAGAWVYLRYTTPVYQVNSSIVINIGKESSGLEAQLESMGVTQTSSSNFDNELLILRSRSLIKSVVSELDLYINYYMSGRFSDVELYNSGPIKVWISPEEASIINGYTKLTFNKLESGNVAVSTIMNGETLTKEFDSFPAQLTTPSVTYNFDIRDSYSFNSWDSSKDFYATIASPGAVAGGYKANLSLYPVSKTTTVVNLYFTTTQRQRGVDFVNKLIEVYNRESADAKNEVSRMTSEFINDRILIIDRELNSTEQKLESYKQNAGIVSVESDAGLAVSENVEYKQRISDNATQLRLVRFLKEYVNKTENKYEILPANVGLIDVSLSGIIGNYNDLLLARKRLLKSSSPNNPAVKNLNANIDELRNTISVTIESVEQTLVFTQRELERKSRASSGRIYDAPTRERELIGIMRQQEIKSGLYLMLLQKREENAMALATTANNARIFEETVSSGVPISPNRRMIYMVALIFGFALPMCVIILIEFLKFRIESIKDVEKITSVPVVGAIPYIKTMPNVGNSIVVAENKNDVMVEGFRHLRTNLLYMLPKGANTILVTSTHPTEGKSYVSMNLAISLALMGKKVVVVGLDIRKSGLDKILGTTTPRAGITSYLSGQTTDLMGLVEEIQPNLHVLYGGAIPPNPTELLSRETTADAINILKRNFDYVILDTAPVGMVTDTFQFSSLADISLYVCRANVTSKSDYSLINEMQASEKLPALCTVVVGVKASRKGYGYGGYGRKYGYGYGQSSSDK
ncbi:MAG: polysaccharide biosynthesis tyrosine autokinase [Rikenellaceae bacterium]